MVSEKSKLYIVGLKVIYKVRRFPFFRYTVYSRIVYPDHDNIIQASSENEAINKFIISSEDRYNTSVEKIQPENRYFGMFTIRKVLHKEYQAIELSYFSRIAAEGTLAIDKEIYEKV